MPHDHHHGADAQAPIVCNIGIFTPDEKRRYRVLTRKLGDAVLGHRELPRGFALQVSGARLTIAQAGEWMLLEGKCCPFLELTLEPLGMDFSLNLSGRDGVKEFLKEEFKF